MKWSQDKSLMLTRICIGMFSLVLAGICTGAPWIYKGFIRLRGPLLDGKLYYFLVTNYAVAVPVALALYWMHRMLSNISKEQVFVPENTAYLRRISWCCVAAGTIFGGSGFYYPAFWALCAGAMFMALVLRVIKNVFAQAEEIKRENDFTI